VLLVMLATLVVLLSTGTVVGLTAVPTAMTPDFPVGSAAIGVAPAATAASTPRAGAGTTPGGAPARSYATPADRSPAVASRVAAPPATDDGILAWEERVLELTNDERRANECDELVMDERLRAAARGHSHDMAVNGYFDHYSLDGRSPTERARAEGYPGGVGENIAMGYRSPEAVMHGWMGSDGHRANILRCSYTVIGVGLAYDAGGRPYWTQNFGSL
jgi:uncharacterized protein YkwD